MMGLIFVGWATPHLTGNFFMIIICVILWMN